VGDVRHIFREPNYLPTKWFVIFGALTISLIGYAFVGGAWKADLEAQIHSEITRSDRIEDVVKAQNLKLDLLLERTARIEGMLEKR
jgi:hypothetical protein